MLLWPALIASRSYAAQLLFLFNVLSTPLDLYESLRSALTTQLLPCTSLLVWVM
jgi:hypothetical protein